MADSSVILSIIIPVYNAAATIERTLKSLGHIAPENRAAVEVIVVNDGSTDGSPELVWQASTRMTDFTWRLIDQPNRGVSAARNAALEIARGDWIFLLDSDDELALDLLPIIRSAGDHSSIGFTLDYRRRERPWRRVRPPRLKPHTWADTLTARNPLATSSLVFRRDHADGRFPEGYAFLEDWLFWFRNPRIFENMKTMPERVSAVIHVHGRSASANYEAAGHFRTLAALEAVRLLDGQLTSKQRNNLTIQAQIGKLQRRQWIPLGIFVTFPCDPLLYAKLWVYALAAILGIKATPYKQ